MKKLLTILAIFAMGQQASASAPVSGASKAEPVKIESVKIESAKDYIFKKVINVPVNAVNSVVSTVESAISKNPKMSILVIAAITLLAEQVVMYAYDALENSDNDEDLDIA